MKCSFYLFAWLFEDNRLARNSQAIFHSVLQTKKNPKVTPVWVQKVFQSNLPTPLIKWMGGNGWGSLRQATRHPGWVPSCPLCVPERVNESEKLTSHNLLVQGLGALKRMKKGNGQKEMMTSEQNLRLPSYPGRLERDRKEFQQMWLEDFPSVIQERPGKDKKTHMVNQRKTSLWTIGWLPCPHVICPNLNIALGAKPGQVSMAATVQVSETLVDRYRPARVQSFSRRSKKNRN